MKLASIDIGTNTVLLLIAEFSEADCTLKTILNRYEIPRLGKNLSQTGIITKESEEAFYKVLKNYFDLINAHQCQVIIAKGTSAMRTARNSSEIIQKANKKFGIEIETISGEEEAYFTFLGSTISAGVNTGVVIDIGGGSTEVIYGENGKILFRKSFPVGTVSLTENFFLPFPVSIERLNKAKTFLTDTFKQVPQLIKNKGSKVISVAGTPTTISAILQNLDFYEEEKIENSILTKTTIEKFQETIRRQKPEQVLERFPFIKGREDMLLAGTLILNTLLELLGARETIVSGKGVRYGVLADFLIKNSCGNSFENFKIL